MRENQFRVNFWCARFRGPSHYKQLKCLFLCVVGFISLSSLCFGNDCYKDLPQIITTELPDCDGDGVPDGCEIVPGIEPINIPPFYSSLNSHAVGAIDLFQDGKKELIVGNQFFKLNDDSFFEWVGDYPLGPGTAKDIQVADFNQDGLEDFVILSKVTSTFLAITVYLQSENAVFKQSFNEDVINEKQRNCLQEIFQNKMTLGDYDLDGDVDILYAPGVRSSSTLPVFKNQGDGTFKRSEEEVGGMGVYEILYEDFNSDDLPDLITLNRRSPFFSIQHNEGGGRYSEELISIQVDRAYENLSASDLDRDGDLDFAFRRECDFSAYLLWNENGEFDRPIKIEDSASFTKLFTLDLNNDSFEEIVSVFPTGIGLYENLTDRKFRTKNVSTGIEDSNVFFEDYNQDSLIDMVISDPVREEFLFLQGQAEFEYKDLVKTFSPAGVLIAADFDGDGIQDVITNRTKEETQVVYYSRDFQVKSEFRFSIGTDIHDIFAHDFDQDGLLDLVATVNVAKNFGSSIELQFYKNTGSQFQKVENTIRIIHLKGLSLGDIDGDGLKDLVFPQGPKWAKNTGGFQFDALREIGTDPSGIVSLSIDLNADGHADVIRDTGSFSKKLEIHFSTSEGFLEPQTLNFQTAEILDIDVGDIDGDKNIDIVATIICRSCFDRRHEIVVLLQKEPGVFTIENWLQGEAQILSDLQPLKIQNTQLIDFDNDNDLDLVAYSIRTVLGVNIREQFFYSNRGHGKFDFTKKLLEPSSIVSEITDLNGDGRLEMMTMLRVLRLFELDLSPAEESDLDHDGVPDFCSIPQLFRRGDANLDGRVDMTDSLVTLRALFLGHGPLPCEDAADSNDDGLLDTSDPITTLVYLFLGGGPLPLPGAEECGLDPGGDDPFICREPFESCVE